MTVPEVEDSEMAAEWRKLRKEKRLAASEKPCASERKLERGWSAVRRQTVAGLRVDRGSSSPTSEQWTEERSRGIPQALNSASLLEHATFDLRDSSH